jgi:hypothetical protein
VLEVDQMTRKVIYPIGGKGEGRGRGGQVGALSEGQPVCFTMLLEMKGLYFLFAKSFNKYVLNTTTLHLKAMWL